jgi:hypothetical protein
MVGPILTFLGVCAIVAIYMSIVHSFLRASEEPENTPLEEPPADSEPERKSHDGSAARLRHLPTG